MSVRVIAGVHRGRRLGVPDLPGLRPTSDRARETLFNILSPVIRGARVLDVFAGSGAFGIEALSRGAQTAVFVERDRRALRAIRENLEACDLGEDAEVVAAPWEVGLSALAAAGSRFDVAFFDPPYDWGGAHTCLVELEAGSLLEPDGRAIIEHRRRSPPREIGGWEILRRVRVGDSEFSFFASDSGAR